MRNTMTNTPKDPGVKNSQDRAKFDSAKTVAGENARILSAITEDYRLGRLAFCDGWIVSATELSLDRTHRSSEAEPEIESG